MGEGGSIMETGRDGIVEGGAISLVGVASCSTIAGVVGAPPLSLEVYEDSRGDKGGRGPAGGGRGGASLLVGRLGAGDSS